MANKYIAIGTDGIDKEVEGLVQSAGAADAGKLIALDPAGKLHSSVMPVGSGYDVAVVIASEAIGAGKFVNIYYDGTATAVRVRLASAASPPKPADGFVLQSVAIGASATVYFEGTDNALSTLSPGVDYFLSAASPGDATTTVPTVAGGIVQKLGKSLSATEIHFEKNPHVVRA